MREALIKQYDSLYASADHTFYQGEPLQILQTLKNFVPHGKVLDIGGGEGRNALYLAAQGFDVIVVDLSKVGLEKLKSEAKERKLKIDIRAGDVVETGIDGDFNVIILSFVLHHLVSSEAVSIIQEAKAHTNPGGLNLIVTFSDQGGLASRNEKTGRFYPSEETIRELYKDWEIVSLDRKVIETLARDKRGAQMKNEAIFLLARKT